MYKENDRIRLLSSALQFYSLFILFYFPFFNTLLKSKGFLLPFR